MVAAWLLFSRKMFLISTEMSTPGIGIPGVLGTLCLVLFFWSQYLGGNADWLKILLFVVGIVFILLELFVVPGSMILGVAGLLMVVLSIVLATQTFLIRADSPQDGPASRFARYRVCRIWRHTGGTLLASQIPPERASSSKD
jgi:membrane-bound ClpP family serine protease